MSKKERKSGHKKREKETETSREKELIETLQRLQAEFENYRKRIEKEKAVMCSMAKADFIKKLLPVIDSFELALKNKEKKEDFIKGMDLVFSELMSVLKKEGLKYIEAEGKKFDPFLHEALLTEKSDKEDGTIIEELQKGYIFNDVVLRHSKVKVAKNKG